MITITLHALILQCDLLRENGPTTKKDRSKMLIAFNCGKKKFIVIKCI